MEQENQPEATAEAKEARKARQGPRDGSGGGVTSGRRVHARSFKLRFAAQHQPGRSNVSAVKPLGLPATVTGKFHRRDEPVGGEEAACERALRRIKDMFTKGPRDKYPQPLTTSHVYGWWWDRASKMAAAKFTDRRLNHHIKDSAWLKARLIVLATDNKLKQQ